MEIEYQMLFALADVRAGCMSTCSLNEAEKITGPDG